MPIVLEAKRRHGLGARVCANCGLAGWRTLADGGVAHWCLQRDRELGSFPARRPACSDFIAQARWAQP